jgi:hypothetical protein
VSKHRTAAAVIAAAACGVAACGSGGHKSIARPAASGAARSTSSSTPQKSYNFSASLSRIQGTQGARDAAAASGTLHATLKLDGTRGVFAWRLRLANLSGRAVTGWIYVGAPGRSSQPAIPLCTPCSVGAYGTYFGSFERSSAVLRALLNGGAYATIQTNKNPGGEIRGRIRAAGSA